MSRLDDIREAYREGQVFAEKSNVFDKFQYQAFVNPTNALGYLSGDNDEQIAFRQGYYGEELELCYECERIQENCRCEKASEDNESSSGDESSNTSDSYSSSESYSGSSGDSSTSTLGCFLIVVIAIGGLIVLNNYSEKLKSDFYERMAGQNQTVWTMREVNTVKLNVRSNPGAKSPVVAQFTQGSRLATTGEPVNIGGDLWIKVSTDDGKIQGWANRKFLSP